MPKLTEREKLIEQYAGLHKKHVSYGKGFVRDNHWREILGFCRDNQVESVLDFGCGKGKLVAKLHKENYGCVGYDPAIEKFKTFPRNKQFDLVVSLDVFEHLLEETWLEELEKIKSVNPKFIYLHIVTIEAVHFLPDKRNAHTLVKDEDWWVEQLCENLPQYRTKYEERISEGPKSIILIFEKKK